MLVKSLRPAFYALIQLMDLDIFDKYQYIKPLGKGVYGEIHLALCKDQQKHYALKRFHQLSTSMGFNRSVLREIAILDSLSHSNVVKMRQVVDQLDNGGLYVVLEYCPRVLKIDMRWEQQQCRPVIKQIAEGLAYIHSKSIIHRDIKPSNILIDQSGVYKICDFGISVRLKQNVSALTQEVVSPLYRAPEVFLTKGNYSSKIDIWSLGCILAELLTGKPLFQGASQIEILDNIFRICGAPKEAIPEKYALLRIKKYQRPEIVDLMKGASIECVQVLRGCLQVSPAKRLSATEVLKSKWLKYNLSSSLEPATQILKKSYSLIPDMINGWRPKSKFNSPVPISFDSPVIDQLLQVISQSLHENWKLVYLGPRPSNSVELHQSVYAKYNHQGKKFYASMNTQHPTSLSFFKKFFSKFFSRTNRPFVGMNPSLYSGLFFDSQFQGGNLDAAIKVDQNQFDLFMRIDSNTYGHNQWFYFRVTSRIKKKVKFNLVNFRKWKTLYSRGMRPYYLSYLLLQKKGQGWQQGPQNVRFQPKKLRYHNILQDIPQEKMLFNQLTWTYEFQQAESVEFAYCIPFSYSDQLKANARFIQLGKTKFIKQETLTYSLGGVPVPMLTITEEDGKKNKWGILIVGRQHPGQSNGSVVLNGFMDFLTSQHPQALFLRKVCKFKIIPMLNVDGVIAGNYRTGLGGKDLNRLFLVKNLFLFPEIEALKNLVNSMRSQHKKRFKVFLDFHGHSLRKNAFFFGPQFGPWDNNYYRSKLLPKIISQKVEMFRYYSCSFRIQPSKRTTARAFLMRFVPFTFTFQVSNYSYYQASDKSSHDFDQKSFGFLGRTVGQSLSAFLRLIQQEEQDRTSKRKRKQDRKRQQQYIKQICEQQQNKAELNQSDQFSENGVDSQASEQDYGKDELVKFQNEVKQSQLQFQRFFNSQPDCLVIIKRKANRQKKGRKKNIPVQMISCLRNRQKSSKRMVSREVSLGLTKMKIGLQRRRNYSSRKEQFEFEQNSRKGLGRGQQFLSDQVMIKNRLPKLY